MKKRIRKVTCCLISLAIVTWIIAGMFARRDMIYLINTYSVTQLDGTQNIPSRYKNDVFGIGFNQHDGAVSDSIWGRAVWFNELESQTLKQKLTTAQLSQGADTENYQQIGTQYGRLYVMPGWVKFTWLKFALLPFQADIRIMYFPNENLMYISEDREELYYDYGLGLSMTNVSKSLLHLEEYNPNDFSVTNQN